jgi:hypothetical protein
MSHLDEFKTKFTDREALVKALCRTLGLTRNQIEVHTKAQTLIGYHGTEDNKVAHVIIRKTHARIPSDIGWEMKDGSYVGHVDDHDYRGSSWQSRGGGLNAVHYNDTWKLKLTENYNFELSKMVFEAKGIKCVECKDNRGRLQLRAKLVSQANKMKIHI